MAKTQVLNTVFKGDVSGLSSDIGRLTNQVSSTLSGIFARAQSAVNISATSGIRAKHAQGLARMEDTLGIPGFAEAITQVTRKHTFKQDAGVRAALRRMGLGEKEFFEMPPPQQSELLAKRLSSIKDPRQRMITASMLGARDPFMMLAQQAEVPGGMTALEQARKAAMRHAGDRAMQERQAQMGQVLRQGWGEVVDTTKDVIGGKPMIKLFEAGERDVKTPEGRSPEALPGQKFIKAPPWKTPESIMEQPPDVQQQILKELEKLNKQMGP